MAADQCGILCPAGPHPLGQDFSGFLKNRGVQPKYVAGQDPAILTKGFGVKMLQFRCGAGL
jgi:hypothetical protein